MQATKTTRSTYKYKYRKETMWDAIRNCDKVLLAIVLALVGLFAFLVFCVVNELGGTETDIPGATPYMLTETYCGAWMTQKHGSQCIYYTSRTRKVVDTKIEGLFFETTGHKTVD